MSELKFPEDLSNYLIGQKHPKLKALDVQNNQLAYLNMIGQARLTIDLLSRDLDPRILNTDSFSAAIRNFVKVSPNSRFRILLAEPGAVVSHGHCLLELARRFSSFISIRKTNEEHRSHQNNFLIVDRKALIYRPNSHDLEALINYDASSECRQHLEFFNDVWEKSEPASELRQLFI